MSIPKFHPKKKTFIKKCKDESVKTLSTITGQLSAELLLKKYVQH